MTPSAIRGKPGNAGVRPPAKKGHKFATTMGTDGDSAWVVPPLAYHIALATMVVVLTDAVTPAVVAEGTAKMEHVLTISICDYPRPRSIWVWFLEINIHAKL